MAQTWHDLLFAHWPVEVATLRPLVPSALPLDMSDGRCWVGVVPFWMSHIHARGLPPLPGLSRFPELNVRTYVTIGGRAGVYFFSLDAANLPAVWAARSFYSLPYFHAKMSARVEGDRVFYRCRRHGREAEFRGEYGPCASVAPAAPGTLEHWLTERHCLYTLRRGKVQRAEIHHQPWPLQEASGRIEMNTMALATGIELPQDPPLLHFAKQLEVLIWPLRPVT